MFYISSFTYYFLNYDSSILLFVVKYPPSNLRILSDLEWLPGNLGYKLDSKLDRSNADLKLTVSTDPNGPYDIYLAVTLLYFNH